MCQALYELYERQTRKKWEAEYADKYNEIRNEARNEGRIEGRNEGRIEGRNEGRIIGMMEFYKDEGMSLDYAITKICQKLKDDSSEMRSRIESLWNTQVSV